MVGRGGGDVAVLPPSASDWSSSSSSLGDGSDDVARLLRKLQTGECSSSASSTEVQLGQQALMDEAIRALSAEQWKQLRLRLLGSRSGSTPRRQVIRFEDEVEGEHGVGTTLGSGAPASALGAEKEGRDRDEGVEEEERNAQEGVAGREGVWETRVRVLGSRNGSVGPSYFDLLLAESDAAGAAMGHEGEGEEDSRKEVDWKALRLSILGSKSGSTRSGKSVRFAMEEEVKDGEEGEKGGEAKGGKEGGEDGSSEAGHGPSQREADEEWEALRVQFLGCRQGTACRGKQSSVRFHASEELAVKAGRQPCSRGRAGTRSEHATTFVLQAPAVDGSPQHPDCLHTGHWVWSRGVAMQRPKEDNQSVLLLELGDEDWEAGCPWGEPAAAEEGNNRPVLLFELGDDEDNDGICSSSSSFTRVSSIGRRRLAALGKANGSIPETRFREVLQMGNGSKAVTRPQSGASHAAVCNEDRCYNYTNSGKEHFPLSSSLSSKLRETDPSMRARPRDPLTRCQSGPHH